MFQCFNVATIGPAISFRSFDVSHKRRWGGYIIILTLNSCSILVFFVATESDSLYLSGPYFNVLMWPVLVLQFHFEVLKFPALASMSVTLCHAHPLMTHVHCGKSHFHSGRASSVSGGSAWSRPQSCQP